MRLTPRPCLVGGRVPGRPVIALSVRVVADFMIGWEVVGSMGEFVSRPTITIMVGWGITNQHIV